MALNTKHKETLVGISVFLVLLAGISYAAGLEGLFYIFIIAALAILSLYLFFKESIIAKTTAIIINTALIYKILMPWKYRSAIRELDDRQLDHADHIATNSTRALSIIANDIKTPQNIGSLFRLCDALGMEHLYLTGTSPTPPNNKIRKTSRATEKSVAYSYHDNPFELVQSLKSQGYQIISLELTSTSIDLNELTLQTQNKICLILGSENKGVNAELLALSDITVHIPMTGQNSSMNVAMAAAIACYEITNELNK